MKKFDSISRLIIDDKLELNKKAKLIVHNANGTTTTVNIAELAALDGVTAGTVLASRVVIVDSNKDISAFRNVGVVNLDAGSSGVAGSVDVFPTTASKGKLSITTTDQTGDTTVSVVIGAMAAARTITLRDPGAAATFVTTTDTTGTAITATNAELNYNDVATLGTLAASKVWTSDASLDTIMPTGGKLTVQSGADITFNSGATLLVDTPTTTTVAAAEHGAGAIGTAATPKTRRWTDRGVIITQTTFDLTGLASVATANDVIGLSAGGVAYIGRNVVATNGVIFKVELSCIETPAGGDNDVNVVANASAALAYDGAGGTTYLSNSGDLLAGQTVQNLLPALTEGDYFYLTAGTGDTAAAYTAGMYVLTTYGHAALA